MSLSAIRMQNPKLSYLGFAATVLEQIEWLAIMHVILRRPAAIPVCAEPAVIAGGWKDVRGRDPAHRLQHTILRRVVHFRQLVAAHRLHVRPSIDPFDQAEAIK